MAPDYKALVCLFLNGGNDGTNLVIPADPASYAAYARARSELAISASGLLPIAPQRYADGRNYALHPSVPALRDLFSQGRLAVLANVGTLVRPTTLAEYRSGRNLPPQLFSHIDQLTQWQSSVSDQPFETGWGGRLADLTNAANTNPEVSMSVTVSGVNSFLRGKTTSPLAVNSAGVVRLGVSRLEPFTTILGQGEDNALAAAFAGITLGAVNDSELMFRVLQSATPLRTAFPGTPTAANLAMVAKLISVSQALGLKRQIFFLQLSGWDTHSAQPGTHDSLLAELSGAMKAFYDATVELGVANQVTTFTASDFGRTYIPNSSGTDHGWGNHQLIMGGAVQGGDIYGAMPSLTVGANDDTGRGRWIPSTSVDEYNATLATWFGVSASNLPVVLPNIGRFPRPNLGFMGA